MNRKRQNNQQELALEPKDRGEAPARGDEETEPFMAKSATENPAFSRLNSIEPPCTDPYARWCGRGGAVRLPPIPIAATLCCGTFETSPPAKEMSVRRSNPEVAYPRSKRR